MLILFRVMKRLFVIFTPYQLICAANIVKASNDCQNTLLLVQPKLKQYVNLCQKLDNTKTIYEDNLCIQYGGKGKFRVHLSMVKEIILRKSLINKCYYLDSVYDELFVPSDDIICRLVYYVLCKKSNPSLYLFDDGTGTYDAHTFKGVGHLGRCVYACLINNRFVNSISKVYCYMPPLMATLPEGVTIHKVTNIPEVSNFFENFAKSKLAAYKNRKVLFFDQGLSGHPSIQKCLNIIKHEFSVEEVIVKIHPRIQGGEYPGFDTSNEGLPFEAIMPSFDLNETLFVAHSSGACFTAYLMSDKKPFIVLLAKLTNTSQQYTPAIQFLKRMQENIPNNRIYLPNSVDEFQSIIDLFKKQNN